MPDIEERIDVPFEACPLQESAGWAAVGAAGAVQGTTLTSGAVNTKGAWAQLIASTAKEAVGLMVSIQVATAFAFLIDIGLGGAGAEVAVIPNLHYWKANATAFQFQCFTILLRIPAGSRISARCQSNAATQTLNIAVSLMEND